MLGTMDYAAAVRRILHLSSKSCSLLEWVSLYRSASTVIEDMIMVGFRWELELGLVIA
jgi:hypothetical protein